MPKAHFPAPIDVSRRQLSRAIAATGLLALFPTSPYAAAIAPREGAASRPRLIVIEMQGGNDSLNTVVPYRDPLYRHYRPTIGIPPAELIHIDADIALNGAMKNIAALHARGHLAIIQDVGYPDPNLSHFESAAIWASGDPAAVHGDGWIARVLAQHRANFQSFNPDADGIVLGGNADLLAGRDIHVLAVDDPAAFIASHPPMPAACITPNSAYDRIFSVVRDQAVISERLQHKVRPGNRFNAWFEKGHYMDPFEQQIALMLWMIESDVYAPVVKISLPGFDMHVNLRGAHEALLARLDGAVTAIARGLQEIGAWQDTVVVAASEFGRRPTENASLGTDHGAAGAVFVFGGPVNGGVFGSRADLSGLDSAGNLKFRTDFRGIYRDIVTQFWRVPADALDRSSQAPLGFI